MTETREFPTEVVATIATGFMLCDFSAMHEAAEFLMGHPIWTHHFADSELLTSMRAAIAEQCPGMPTREWAEASFNKENWQQKRDEIIREIGPVVRIRRGSGLTAMHPADGIPDHLKDKTIIVRKS